MPGDNHKKKSSSQNIYFDIVTLKLMGILWCDGEPNEKIIELYHVLQDNHQEKIAWNDKDTPATLKSLFDLATSVVFKQIKGIPELAKCVAEVRDDRIE